MPDEPLDLFATPAPEPRPVGALDVTNYRQRLAALAAQGIYVGTSSWKYPGWCGMIYDEQRYRRSLRLRSGQAFGATAVLKRRPAGISLEVPMKRCGGGGFL